MESKMEAKMKDPILESIQKEIKEFKEEIADFTKWETGRHILDFINTRKAFEYGKLIGKKDMLNILNEKQEAKNEKRMNGKIIQSYDNKLLIEISEDDYAFTNFDDAEVIIEMEWIETPEM